MILQIVLRDTAGYLPNYPVRFKIRDSKLAESWCDLLITNVLTSNHPIEKTYCLHGWQQDWDSTYSRNLDYLCKQLNLAIEQVNLTMPAKGYPYIDLNFSVDKLKSSAYRTLMNDIHHHFEMLIGQVWNPSPWFGMADDKTRAAIRMLNNYCHEIEYNVKSVEKNLKFKWIPFVNVGCHIGISMNSVDSQGRYFSDKISNQITQEEYECFDDTADWGCVTIYYAQLGKSHREAYDDNDTHIDKDNISSYQRLTGEFNISFYGKSSITNDFKRWLRANDFDINDKTLGIGYPVVADIITDGLTKSAIRKELLARDDVYAIELLTDNGTIIQSKQCNYTWKDQDWTF